MKVFKAVVIQHWSASKLLDATFCYSVFNARSSLTVSKRVNDLLHLGCMTHQYGVPMKESLLCNVLVFLADTPKSAESRNKIKLINIMRTPSYKKAST